MNWVHIHLMTNHAPVIGIIIGFVIVAVGLLWRSADLKRFALFYFVALGIVTLVVYLTGEPAEEAIEHMAGVSHPALEEHEEASLAGLIAVELVAVMSLAGLVLKRVNLEGRPLFWKVLLALTIIATGVMGWVANLGGKIRHTETSQSG